MKKILIGMVFLFSFTGTAWAADTQGASTLQNAGSSLDRCPDPTQEKTSSGYCVDINEPFVQEYDLNEGKLKPVVSVRGENGFEMFSNYLSIVYRYAASIIGIICVLIVVISGIQIIAGGASSESVTSAKTRMFMALGSLALLFMIGLILKTINPGFFT